MSAARKTLKILALIYFVLGIASLVIGIAGIVTGNPLTDRTPRSPLLW